MLVSIHGCITNIGHVASNMECPIGESRVSISLSGAAIETHVDVDYYWKHRLRVHIVLQTNPQALFGCMNMSFPYPQLERLQQLGSTLDSEPWHLQSHSRRYRYGGFPYLMEVDNSRMGTRCQHFNSQRRRTYTSCR